MVTEVLAQLAVMQRAVNLLATGDAALGYAYDSPPNTISETDMPAWFTLPGPAVYDDLKYGAGYIGATTTYRMYVLVGKIGQGGPGELPARAVPFLELTKPYFAARPALGNLNGVQSATVSGNSGVTQITYNGDPCVGVEFDIEVEEIIPYEYATGQ